jgi:hypothetical protein
LPTGTRCANEVLLDLAFVNGDMTRHLNHGCLALLRTLLVPWAMGQV